MVANLAGKFDFAIEIEGLRNSDNEFIPKEVAIISLINEYYANWLIKSPHPYLDLAYHVRCSNDTASSHGHGIHWADGDITLGRLKYLLNNVVQNGIRIYTKGYEKANYLEKLLSRQIIDIEYFGQNEQYTEFCKKPDIDKVLCLHHATKPSSHVASCALHNARVLRKFLHSLIESRHIAGVETNGQKSLRIFRELSKDWDWASYDEIDGSKNW